ncbi:hypothetical protein IMSHALPRED_003673 [Imshaugia aleurites]|uniref:Rhodopsin domain-containing protein n=1 Tax=Imshaugia aleurites TaxID=172621 RepID=A0A8H3PJH7_9LECA|nr:hypothetical protein IMSHALPRED_003673 [Imshaugia aleurites]
MGVKANEPLIKPVPFHTRLDTAAQSTKPYTHRMEKDRGPILTSNVLAFGITTFFVFALRISYRLYTKKTSASDWVLAVALLSSLAQDAFNAICVTQWGYGHREQDLPAHIRNSTEPVKLLWLNQIFFKLTTMLFKLSICFIYYNIFQRANSRLIRATRAVTYCLTLLIIGYYVPAFFVSIFQCKPVSKSWRSKEAGSCIDLNTFRFCTAAANMITSALVIITPLPALYKMRDTRPEVTELIGLILLGANITPLTIAIVEMDVGIIAASLIVMRPCFEAIYNAVLKGCGTSSARNNKLLRDKGIVRTTDFELESQSASTREVVPKDLI